MPISLRWILSFAFLTVHLAHVAYAQDCGNLTLSTQEEVSNFSCTQVNRLWIESGESDPITDLSPLHILTQVRDLTVIRTPGITTLTGLHNVSVAVTVLVMLNDGLTSLEGLEGKLFAPVALTISFATAFFS